MCTKIYTWHIKISSYLCKCMWRCTCILQGAPTYDSLEKERNIKKLTQYSSSNIASRAIKRPKFRFWSPVHSWSVSCSRSNESSGNLEFSFLERGKCWMLWSLLQWTSRFFHLSYWAGNVSLYGFGVQNSGQREYNNKWSRKAERHKKV